MNEEAIKRFMQSKDRAKRLIQMDANGSFDNLVEDCKKSGKIDYSLSDTPPMLENSTQQRNVSYSSPQQPIQINSNSKLPKEILESFRENNIDTSLLGVGVGQTSVLEQIDSLTNGKLFEEKPRQKVVAETSQRQAANQGGVDYSMIKMIVEDCVKKYTSALKKSMLNESKNMVSENNLAAMKIGDKFSFIDASGNLYEAKLEFIKNINAKKRA